MIQSVADVAAERAPTSHSNSFESFIVSLADALRTNVDWLDKSVASVISDIHNKPDVSLAVHAATAAYYAALLQEIVEVFNQTDADSRQCAFDNANQEDFHLTIYTLNRIAILCKEEAQKRREDAR